MERIFDFAVNEINYQEDPSFEGFQITQYATYNDGTILLRIRPNADGNCRASGLYFRLIRTDGTISQITLNNTAIYNISSQNYCFVNNEIAFTLRPLMASIPQRMTLTWLAGYAFPINLISSPTDSLRVYGIATNYILISYVCGDLTSPSPSVCGLLLDWNGNVLSSGINLGDNCDDVNIAQNINPNIGEFFWVCYMKSNSQLVWRRFGTPDSSGTMNTLGVGRINGITKFSPNYTSIFPLEDGGYGIVTAQYNTTNLTTQGTAYTPPWTVFVYFISDSGTKGPFQLYEQTTQSLNQLKISTCSISFQSSGYNCIIYQVLVGATEPSFITIDFFRTGARKISQEFTIAGLETYQYVVWNILNLYQGGYCVLRQNINTTVIDGLLYDDVGNPNGTWRMPTTFNYTRNIGVYPNNTLWAIVNGPNNLTWTFETSSALVDFRTVPDPDGFKNAFISAVSPGNSSIVPLSSTPSLTITFTTNIILSSGNVSIYQSNGSSPILRQTFQGTDSRYVRLLNGNNSNQVQFDVLTSTFNQRSSNYFIQVDNAFVQDIQNSQPLLGIRPSLWIVSTAQESAVVRLTPAGSKYFRELSDSNRSQFAAEMSEDLSNIIPCDKDRIKTTSNYQLDDSRQVLIRIDVRNYDANSSKERVPTKVLKDLDNLIKNRGVTGVSHEFCTSLLDSSYGSQLTQDLWNNYRFLLWILLVIVGVLSILVCLSIMRHKKGKHCAVFMFTFLVIDFVLDILFVVVHGQDLYWLYPASVIFITIPIIVNSGFTFLLISREISKNKKFSNWWFRSSKTALLFTILAGADIDVLNILSSECGRLEELSAPFSITAMKRIRIFNIISIIIEDLPQLIILIRAESPDIPSKPESPNSGKDSDTSPTHSEVRHEYLTMKDDGVPTISYPRDEMQIHDIPHGHVGESIINIEGTSGEIGETLKKTQTLPKRKSDSGIIESTGEPGQSTSSTTGAPTYQSKMIEQLDPSSEQNPPPKSTSSKLFSFIGGGKSKKGTTAPKEEADKGKKEKLDLVRKLEAKKLVLAKQLKEEKEMEKCEIIETKELN
ncbi:1024_t:CDS:10 [Dentiscutata erythropus]|uniref:1024_t:CDS:1 n=1 Tax=Dentiscutata erythropus TaxID=1348616 RepID=A0A9N9AGM4_9GLOM|nr:1024_t:CDS:10 [Dentiscutata erythropus]